MSIACSTSVYCNRPLDEALAQIATLGIPGIDLLTIDGWVHVNTRDLADNWEATIASVDTLLNTYHLTPIATNSGVSAQLHQRTPEINAQRRREIEALVRFANYYNIQVAAIQPRNKDTSRPWETVLADCVETLREQKRIGDAAGVTFALELHVNSPFETVEQARRFCDVMPEMPLVYDPTHFVMQGVDIRETEWVMERAAHVHLRDAAPGQMQTHFGSGAIDFDWVLRALQDHGYQGHISIEYLASKEMDVRDDVLRLYDHLARYFDV